MANDDFDPSPGARRAQRCRNPATHAAVLGDVSAAATGDELREVRELLVRSPGRRPVQLLFDRANGNSLRMDAGADFRVNLTPDLEEKLSRWLVR